MDPLYAIGSGPSSGCVCGSIIIALDHIEMFIIFIHHVLHTLFLYSQLIYYVIAQATDKHM